MQTKQTAEDKVGQNSPDADIIPKFNGPLLVYLPHNAVRSFRRPGLPGFIRHRNRPHLQTRCERESMLLHER